MKQKVNIIAVFSTILFLTICFIITIQYGRIIILKKEVKVFESLGKSKNIEDIIKILGREKVGKLNKSEISGFIKEKWFNINDYDYFYSYNFIYTRTLIIFCDNEGNLKGFYLHRT